jgi:hypothetical protein
MADRKPYLGPPPVHPELDELLEKARKTPVSEDQINEQRVSFAYGNAPENSGITKESIRNASKSVRRPFA